MTTLSRFVCGLALILGVSFLIAQTVQAQVHDRSDPEPRLEQESAEELNVLGIIEQISLKTKKLVNDPVIRIPEAESFKPVFLNPKIKHSLLESLRSGVITIDRAPSCTLHLMQGPYRHGNTVKMYYRGDRCTTGDGSIGFWRIFTQLFGPGTNSQRTTNKKGEPVWIHDYESRLTLTYAPGSWTAKAKLTVRKEDDWFRRLIHITDLTVNL